MCAGKSGKSPPPFPRPLSLFPFRPRCLVCASSKGGVAPFLFWIETGSQARCRGPSPHSREEAWVACASSLLTVD